MKRVSFSSCGVCGKQNYSELNPRISRVRSRVRFSMAMINTCSRRLEEHQKLYWRTGGAHAAMLLDRKAAPVLFSEDMGRHNALDKVIGAALLQHIPMDDKILVSSGRASLEMILKTARAGIPLFVAMSRPTSKAVEAAKVYNVTLVDLAKGSNGIGILSFGILETPLIFSNGLCFIEMCQGLFWRGERVAGTVEIKPSCN
ncbi:MAG: hypothetical protein B1H13_08550 [Desulfobacteraceae bacterium 4484_190.3]|nr:MAG: hypothetical protein B1H13_08550 [Desulfobacteraceae bacterium 4484_190.3]